MSSLLGGPTPADRLTGAVETCHYPALRKSTKTLSLALRAQPKERDRRRSMRATIPTLCMATLSAASAFEGVHTPGVPVPYFPSPPGHPPPRFEGPYYAQHDDPKIQEFLVLLRSKGAQEVATKHVAPVLETVLDTNDRLQGAGVQEQTRASVFRVRKPPSISIKSYLERMVRLSGCSAECLVIALVYLDRMASREYVTPLTIHRLLLASLMIAAKHKESGKDRSYEVWEQISRLPESELKILESSMLKGLNYNIEVTPREIFDYGRKALQWRRQSMFRPENP